MKVIYDHSTLLPHHDDNIVHIHNWKPFENDHRTKDVVLYWGVHFNVSKLDPKKNNIFVAAEHPGIYFLGKQPGENVARNDAYEKVFDHLLTFSLQTSYSRKGFQFMTHPYDVKHVHDQIGISDINDIEKDIDVSMCGSCVLGRDHPVEPWLEVIKKFNYSFSCFTIKEYFKKWHTKQSEVARSKIHVVWSSFITAPDKCSNFAKENFPWIKWKKGKEVKNWVTPQFKHRIHDAAAHKCVMLCYKDPFAGQDYPHYNSIEHYYEPNVDFLYFEDSKDLERIIKDVLQNFNDPKYKNMVDSAYDKVLQHTTAKWHEDYIVPLAKREK